ncbi:MAG TPA: type I-D CRISPR-associated helicase Cas3', partial [Ktedonobacterales bacterium]
MKIHLLPVYSKCAAPDLLARVLRGRTLPEGIHLSEHQALTLEALETPGIQVVLNAAMTGDGKSLAAYLRPLIGAAEPDEVRPAILGLYPTIELTKDQAGQFTNYQNRFGRKLRHTTLWGDRLTELAGSEHGGRAHALIEVLKQHEVLLTNPDMFIRMLNYQFRPGIFTAQEIPYSVLTNFNLLLFDEFHLFSMPQFAAAATALVYAQEHDPRSAPKALFSSATQHPALLRLIERAGLKKQIIQGSYASPGAEPAALAGEYRQILYPADLHLHQLTGDQTIESWVREHLDLITAPWRGERARAAIIVSSVATAHRIAEWLKAELTSSPLKPGGWRVEEVTGHSHGSLKADIVVGTSTIDVGIDFDINLLIFEALNVGQFLQRLGRLGRCRWNGERFPSYTAHALISAKTPWVSARLIETLRERGVEDGGIVDRPDTLHAAVEASYPTEADFAPYVQRWGALQGYHLLHVLRHELREYGSDQSGYTSLADALEPRYTRLYNLKSLRPIRSRYYRLSKGGVYERPLLEEVLSFRGSSPFQVCLWDPTRPDPADQFQVYDLFFVLKATEWTPIS